MREPPAVNGFRDTRDPGRLRRLATLGVLASVAVVGPWPAAAGAQRPGPLPACCRELNYLYEASIFKIDAMQMRVRVDDLTAAAVEAVVRGGPRSSRLEEAVAGRYQGAMEATVEMEFVVGVSGETFVGNSLKAFRNLVRDGVLTTAEADAFSSEFRDRFSFLHAAKVRRGDRLLYQVSADTLTTTYSRGGTVLMHDRHVGKLYRDITLATYFAPSSDFRRGLLNQVFRP